MNSRFPRPLGATLMAQNYQKSQSEEDKSSFQDLMINAYLISGFKYANTTIPITDMAKILCISEASFTERLYQKSSKVQNFLDPMVLQNTVNTLLHLTTNWSIQNHGEILNQIEVMKRSQGKKFKPFITSSLNQILETAIKSTKGLNEILGTLTSNRGKDQTPIILNLVQNQNQGNDVPLTIAQALEILENQPNKEITENKALSIGTTLMDPDELKQLQQKYSSNKPLRKYQDIDPEQLKQKAKELKEKRIEDSIDQISTFNKNYTENNIDNSIEQYENNIEDVDILENENNGYNEVVNQEQVLDSFIDQNNPWLVINSGYKKMIQDKGTSTEEPSSPEANEHKMSEYLPKKKKVPDSGTKNDSSDVVNPIRKKASKQQEKGTHTSRNKGTLNPQIPTILKE